MMWEQHEREALKTQVAQSREVWGDTFWTQPELDLGELCAMGEKAWPRLAAAACLVQK